MNVNIPSVNGCNQLKLHNSKYNFKYIGQSSVSNAVSNMCQNLADVIYSSSFRHCISDQEMTLKLNFSVGLFYFPKLGQYNGSKKGQSLLTETRGNTVSTITQLSLYSALWCFVENTGLGQLNIWTSNMYNMQNTVGSDYIQIVSQYLYTYIII